MNADIKKLIELQEVDKKIAGLQKKCAQSEKEISDLQGEINKAGAEQKAAEECLSETQKEHRRLEREVEEKQVKVDKYKAQTASVKNNKEYQALQEEIQQEEAVKGVIEEKIIKALDQVEEQQNRLKRCKEQVKAIESKVVVERKQKQETLVQLQAEIKTEQEAKTQIAKEISARMLAEYNKLLNKRGGIALASVKNCTCQGCFINIPAQEYEELKQGEKIYFCSNCSRILYWYGVKQA